VDRQNSTSTPDQNTPASNSAPAQTPDRQNTAPDQNTGNQNTGNQNTGNNAAGQSNAQIPTYRVTVVQRTTQAVDYRDRGGTTQLDFKGTSLMPEITGTARVTGHTGRLAIDASLHRLGLPRG